MEDSMRTNELMRFPMCERVNMCAIHACVCTSCECVFGAVDVHHTSTLSLSCRVLLAAFQQRRKMMRQSLKDLLEQENLTLPPQWGTLRPEQLTPPQFLELTAALFGEVSNERDVNTRELAIPSPLSKAFKLSHTSTSRTQRPPLAHEGDGSRAGDNEPKRRSSALDRSIFESKPIWRNVKL